MSTTKIYIFAFFALLFVVVNWLPIANAATPVRQCTDITRPLPLMVQIDKCDTMPCDLWKGIDTNIIIQFVATKNTMRQLTAKVHLTTLGMTIPYDLDEKRSNVCNNLLYDAYCPLDAGEDVTYVLEMPISETQPEVPTKLEITLHDDSDNSIVACFIADTRVKKPNLVPIHH